MLLLGQREASTQPLRTGLEELGFEVDVAADVPSARSGFLERGGHTLLVVTSDVPKGVADQAIRTLRSVDRYLSVIVFGDDIATGWDKPWLHRVRSFPPASRAALGAIQRILYQLA